MSLGATSTGNVSGSPSVAGGEQTADAKLEELLDRIKQMAGKPGSTSSSYASAPRPTEPETPAGDSPRIEAGTSKAATSAAPSSAASVSDEEFVPVEPRTFKEARLSEAETENIVLKLLLSVGSSTGRDASEQLKLPFKMIDELMFQLKTDQLVYYRGTAIAGDYMYQLTDAGREKARRLASHCTYFGSAPVNLIDYIASVNRQSLTRVHPSVEDLNKAFEDLLMNKKMLSRLGPAINSGRGLFLFGAPGNGKTSVAERITRAFGDSIWIPRSLSIDGEIVRLFDPSVHEVMPIEKHEGLFDHRQIDRRWIRVRRPTIIAGGELTMDSLEVTLNRSTGISEAPLQLKRDRKSVV